jgi:hypothetical protein
MQRRIITFGFDRDLLPIDNFGINKQYMSNDQFPVDWSPDAAQDLISLHTTFNNQVANNYIFFENLLISCEENTGELSLGSCLKVRRVEHDIQEVMSRDVDVFTGMVHGEPHPVITEAIYPVVYVKNNEYQGHIYAWRSPETNVLLAMGIRSHPVNVLLPKEEKENVSAFLLEGVRVLALQLQCNSIIIAFPLPIMLTILPNLGFKREFVRRKIFGYGLAPRDDCYHCMVRDVTSPIHTIPVNFNYIVAQNPSLVIN